MTQRAVCSLAGCGKAGVGRCSKCKAWYCSIQCQEDDWPTHLRFCFEIPALEWWDTENNKNDSVNSTNSGNTILAGSVRADEATGSVDVKTKKEKTDNGIASNQQTATNKVVSREENNNSTVLATEKKSVSKADEIIKETTETEAETKVVEKEEVTGQKVVEKVEKTEPRVKDVEEVRPRVQSTESVAKQSEVSSSLYKEAFISPKMAAQETPAGLSEMVLSHAVSPSEFYIHLLADCELYNQMQELLMEMETPADGDWKIGRKEPVRAFIENSWHRGFAVKKKGLEFDVFLLDIGEMVTVKQENLKRLPDDLMLVPPFAYQVCLSGIGPAGGGEYSPEEIEAFVLLLNDETYPMMVQFLGQLQGGRWLVKLQGKEDQADLTQFMLENKLCKASEDAPVTPPPEVSNEGDQSVIPGPEKEPTPVKLVRGPVVTAREMLAEGCEATIKCLVSLATFYIAPTGSQELFSTMTELAQISRVEGEVDPVLGTVCLARDPQDGLYYRAEILEAEQDRKVSLFLIDHGKMLVEEVKQLRPLDEELATEPGILIKVSLRGIKDLHTYSEDDLDMVKTVFDVGGETKFSFTEPKLVDGKWFINATDLEGGDLAELLIQCEFAAEELLSGSELTPAVLQEGNQEMIIIKPVSPVEMYTTNNSMLDGFNFERLNKIGENSDYVHILKAGDLILAFHEDNWNRATVVDPDALKMKFVDFPEVVQIEKKMLRKAPREVLEFPVLVARCVLHSFYGREEEAAGQVEKLKTLELEYASVEGEVVGSQDGMFKVKIPSVESQLVPPVVPSKVSSREALLQKLRKK